MTLVRIFISSPGDVAVERAQAMAVVETLQAEFEDTLTLEALLWEEQPLLASSDFQSQIPDAREFDVFTTIIGARLGSPLGPEFQRADGSTYASGTEYEFEIAMAGFRSAGKPELLVYRKSIDPAAASGETQFEAVDAFFNRWFLSAADGTATGAYHSFADPQQFEHLFTLHLRKLLRRFLPRPNNLPAPISSFVGRQQLLEEIRAALFAPDTRLVALVGPGGTGKSRLALRSARTLLPDFDDGVFLVPLATLRDSDLVPQSIASALDIKPDDQGSVLDAVINELRERRLLLVIDNLEQLQSSSSSKSAGAHISALLAACPGVKALLTSRSAPRVSGVRTIRVPPFELPTPGSPFSEIVSNESVQLLVDRAQAQRPDFSLNPDNADDVLAICHRLDGLPLAIELAASRLRSMEPPRLLRALEKRFAVLKGGADDLLDHQRSLRELINWSYELLTEEEQTLWRRLAVFVGGCTMDAAEAVCDPDDEFVVDIEVEGLADHSLVSIVFTENAPTRVTMLTTLREFAMEKLDTSGERPRTEEAFWGWCAALASESRDLLWGATSSAQLLLLEGEHTNLQAAIEALGERGEPGAAIGIAADLWYYWFEHGYLQQARQWLAQADEELPELPNDVRARALRGLAAMARFQNDLDDGERYGRAALALFESEGNTREQAHVLGELGAIAQRRGELEQSAELLDRALALYAAVPEDLHGRSFVSAARGVVNHLQGDLAGARGYYQTALDIGGESGDSDSIASALVNMGELEEAANDIEAAYRHYADSLALFADRGKKVAIAYCAEVLAGLDVKHRNNAADAALLFGFAAHLREQIAAPIEPFNAERLDADMAAARAALSEEAYSSAWRTGATLSVADVLSLIAQRRMHAEVH